MLSTTDIFYKKLSKLSRQDLLGLIGTQDLELLNEIRHCEDVFTQRLNHLNWPDGTPIMGRPFTNQELAYLIDQPFEVNTDLTKLGLSIQEQKNIHVAKDTILWAKHFLKAKPRVYQILMVRHPSRFKVLRAGRRLGKTYTMALILLHHAWTTTNGRALVVTPMKAQAGLIYEEMIKLAKNSSIVWDSITRNVTSPQHEINFSNGSTVRFFTSGMKTGSKSDITRGQEAQVIILDELDYMGDDDLDALFAMLQQTEENQAPKKMIGASTPTGRRGTFWRWCNGKTFKEFWFPSYCNPFWSEEMEQFFREEYSEIGYKHEIEADWGEDAEGVYPRRYLDIAFKEPGWDYIPSLTSTDSIYVAGVDWDKYGAGVSIVVLEMMSKFHPNPQFRGKIRLCFREETKKEEYALTNAVDRIIQLNRNFKFSHVYVDRGFGEVQVELLHKYGHQHPESGLDVKVKGVSFAETIEMRDPASMAKIKKDMKPFMVENLRTMLEREQVIFPSHDEELYMQLISYIVARTTTTGRPVFEISTKNVFDHAHDALILAALGITQNYGDLMKLDYATRSYGISNEAFLATFELSADPSVRAAEEEMIEDKWGDVSKAPVQVRRAMTYNRKRGTRPIQRRMF